MDTTEVQDAFLAACDKLRTFQCNAAGCLRCSNNMPVRGARIVVVDSRLCYTALVVNTSGTTPRLLVLDADSVTCPLENYRTWYRVCQECTPYAPMCMLVELWLTCCDSPSEHQRCHRPLAHWSRL